MAHQSSRAGTVTGKGVEEQRYRGGQVEPTAKCYASESDVTGRVPEAAAFGSPWRVARMLLVR